MNEELEFLIRDASNKEKGGREHRCLFCLDTNEFTKSPFESDNGSYTVRTKEGKLIGSLQFEMRVFKEHGMYIHILSDDEIEFLTLRLL
jgi:hypothetical protein